VLEYIKVRDQNPIPGVMPILAGLGSPQEMKIHDEKWHTENFMWGNSRTRRKDYWNEGMEEKWKETRRACGRG
jgi:benzoyl-CoA reductase subunit BamB